MSKFSRNQVGSILSFISIAIVLVFLIVGSIYFVNQRAETARKNEASKLAEQAPQDSGTEISAPVNEGPSSASVAVTTSSSTVSSSLPETGIELNVIQMLAIGIMTASFSSFMISKSELKRSL